MSEQDLIEQIEKHLDEYDAFLEQASNDIKAVIASTEAVVKQVRELLGEANV